MSVLPDKKITKMEDALSWPIEEPNEGEKKPGGKMTI